jgi:hypothetical protein
MIMHAFKLSISDRDYEALEGYAAARDTTPVMLARNLSVIMQDSLVVAVLDNDGAPHHRRPGPRKLLPLEQETAMIKEFMAADSEGARPATRSCARAGAANASRV